MQAASRATIPLSRDSALTEGAVALPESNSVQDLTVTQSGGLFVLVGPSEHLVRVSASGDVHNIPLTNVRFADFSMRLGWLGDTLWAGGFLDGRFRLFTAQGDPLNAIALRTDSTSPGTYLPTGATALLANGSGLAKVEAAGTLIASGEVLGQPLLAVLRSGAALDTLAWLRTTNAVMELSSDEHPESGLLLFRQPFRDTPLIGVSRLGDMIVVVDRGASVPPPNCQSYKVITLTPNGDTIFERRITYDPIPIETRVVLAVTKETEEQALKARHVFNSRHDVDRAIHREMWVPKYYPPVDTVIVATDSSIWIRREADDDPAHWTVIGPRGKTIGQVVIPRHVKVLEIAPPFVWGVLVRSGVPERLVRYKLGEEYYSARGRGSS